jgi:copper homeostasis protein
MMKLEICAANIESALNAQIAGADRIEYCDNLWEGGTTASFGLIKSLRKELNIELFVLIRPRGGDFLYSTIEFESMLEDIKTIKNLGVDGIVSGVLKKDASIDQEKTSKLVEATYPLPFTFHRAFDMSNNLFESMEEIINCGASRILSSGGANSVSEGLEILKTLNDLASDRIIIMPGAGINLENFELIKQKSQCKEFHLSAKKLKYSEIFHDNKNLTINGSRDIPETGHYVSDVEIIKKIKSKFYMK